MNTPKIAALYRRVSTDHQDGSLETQEARLADYAKLMGFDHTQHEYSDEAASGGVAIWERKGGRALVTAIQAGEIRHLIVAKLDRLGRSARDFHNFLHWIEDHKVTLHIMDMGGSICTTDGAGKLLLGVLALVAEFERDLIRSRIKERLDYKFSKDQLIGSVPYGWTVEENDGQKNLVPHPEEVAWIRRMAVWRQSGAGFHIIAMELNKSQVATKIPKGTPIKFKGRTQPASGLWQYSTVRTVLESKHTKKLLKTP
jgi:DNA invertase Pin-like site-specific DNA recombinase